MIEKLKYDFETNSSVRNSLLLSFVKFPFPKITFPRGNLLENHGLENGPILRTSNLKC